MKLMSDFTFSLESLQHAAYIGYVSRGIFQSVLHRRIISIFKSSSSQQLHRDAQIFRLSQVSQICRLCPYPVSVFAVSVLSLQSAAHAQSGLFGVLQYQQEALLPPPPPLSSRSMPSEPPPRYILHSSVYLKRLPCPHELSFNLMQTLLDLMGGVVTWSALFKELWRISEVIRSFHLPEGCTTLC